MTLIFRQTQVKIRLEAGSHKMPTYTISNSPSTSGHVTQKHDGNYLEDHPTDSGKEALQAVTHVVQLSCLYWVN